MRKRIEKCHYSGTEPGAGRAKAEEVMAAVARAFGVGVADMVKDDKLKLVGFGQAKRLNALGFDWPTIARYDNHGILYDYYDGNENWNDEEETDSLFSAPTVALALKWLRDVKGISSYISATASGYWTYYIWSEDEWLRCLGNYFSTYEEAETALLDAVIAELGKAGRAKR